MAISDVERFDVADDSERTDPADASEIPEKGTLAWARRSQLAEAKL
jgi:hypothetical protein